MQTAECERPMRGSPREPITTAAAAMKCGAALAVLTLLAVIGNSGSDTGVPAAAGTVGPAASVQSRGPAAAHRRQVFAERRAAWQGADQTGARLDGPAEQTAGLVTP